jgi:hypothetical protein
LILKLVRKDLSIAHTNHANISPKFEFIVRCRFHEWSSRLVLAPEYYMTQGLPPGHGFTSCSRWWPWHHRSSSD